MYFSMEMVFWGFFIQWKLTNNTKNLKELSATQCGTQRKGAIEKLFLFYSYTHDIYLSCVCGQVNERK